jgi:tight adherence protein C
MRVLIAVGLLVWLGSTLLLSGWRRMSRPSLVARLRPFSPGLGPDGGRRSLGSFVSLRELVGPLAQGAGDRAAALLGVEEPLAVRLRRVHSPLDQAAFRTRQLGWAGAGLASGLLAAGLGAPVPGTLLLIVGAPILAFLLVEHRLSQASSSRQERLARELPVVAEQLAMLLNAGFSLGASINRLADRGQGCCAQDLRVVANRVRQGIGETAALREWADVARVEGLHRLVGILALNSEASDLGRLVSSEARQARRDLQRRTSELIERRGQQVWIPVSVATLVPGVILLAIPFLAALRLFANA